MDDAPEGRVFGQVVVRPVPPHGYSLRHADEARDEGLRVSEDPRAAREIARLTEGGEYRPLKSSPNLRRGWELRLEDARSLVTAINYLYPAGVVHWYLNREERLDLTSFRENAARQSGIYKRVQRLTDQGVIDAAIACCEDSVCLKKTLWDVDEDTPLDVDRGEGEIPAPSRAASSSLCAAGEAIRAGERPRRHRPLLGEKTLPPSSRPRPQATSSSPARPSSKSR